MIQFGDSNLISADVASKHPFFVVIIVVLGFHIYEKLGFKVS